MEDSELKRQAVYAKQGRSSQFRNRKERDAWLGKEIQEIDRTMMTQQQQVNFQDILDRPFFIWIIINNNLLFNQANDLESQISNLTQSIERVSGEIQNTRTKMEQRKGNLEEMNNGYSELKVQRDKLTDQRKFVFILIKVNYKNILYINNLICI